MMRLLWSRYGDGKGVPEDGVEAAASEVAGSDLRRSSTARCGAPRSSTTRVLAHVGLRAPRPASASPRGTRAARRPV